MMISLCMPRFKLQVLEARDFEKEFLTGLREKIGTSIGNSGNFSRREHQYFELEVKLKGLPFLEFKLNNMNLRMLQ